jgi:hypothetical protein
MLQEQTTIRKVQSYSGERSLTIVLPKLFSAALHIEKGDFMKVHMVDKKLILEKAAL